MVAISITPAKGNAGARWFPHSGHLGLSPVKLEGVVRTRVEEDGKTATSSGVTISIRCYEARLGRVGVTKSNVLYEESQTLWTPEGVYGQLGSLELPFRLVVSPNAGGNSTFQLPEYRVYWRIEAAIHTPHIAGIGTRQLKCFDVNLVRYNKPSPQPTVYHVPAPHCELQLPRQPVAPLDPIPLSVSIHTPPGTVQRVTLALERHVELFDVSPSSSTTQLATPSMLSRQSSRDSSPGCCSSTMALLPPSPDRPSSSSGLSHKTIDTVLATTDITEIPRPAGSNSLTAMLQVPLPKSNAHWGVGETMQGELARVRFFITAKVQMALGGSEFTEYCQEEITVVAVDDAERLRVHSKYRTKRPASSPSSSVENHSEKRSVPHLPSPPPSPNNLAVPKNKSKRPHTSSGTRESRHPLRPRSRGNETTPVPTAFEPEQFRAWERELDRIAPPRPRSSTGLRLFGSKKRSSPEPRPAATRTVVVPSAKTAEVLEWEAEVERFSSASAREAVLSRGPLGVPC